MTAMVPVDPAVSELSSEAEEDTVEATTSSSQGGDECVYNIIMLLIKGAQGLTLGMKLGQLLITKR